MESEVSFGELLLKDTVQFTVEQAPVMLKNEADGLIRTGYTAERLEGIEVSRLILLDDEKEFLLEMDNGTVQKLGGTELKNSKLVLIGPDIVLVFPEKSRNTWLRQISSITERFMKININRFLLSILLLLFLGGCKSAWSIQLDSERLAASFSESEYRELDKEFVDDGGCQGLPLEAVLYRTGFEVIDSVILEDASGKQIRFDWEDKGKTGCINQKGRISIDSQEIDADEILIKEEIYDHAIWRITDIAPTALSALGVNASDFRGKTA